MKKILALVALLAIVAVPGAVLADDPDGNLASAQDHLSQASALIAAEAAAPRPTVTQTVTETETVTPPPVTVTQTVTTTVTQTVTVTPPPPVQTVVGVNERYFEDFRTKVAPVENVRIYLATQTVGSGSFYNRAEALAAQGFTVWLTFKSTPTPSFLTSFEAWLNTLPGRHVVDYFHEPEDNVEGGEFSAATYVANFRAMSTALSDSADIAWNIMAWSFTPGAPDSREALVRSLYPGDAYVDIIGADVYLRDNSGQTWPNALQPFIDWAKPHGKDLAIFEWGVNRNATGMTTALRAQRITEFFDIIEANPEFVAVLLWESTAVGDYEIRNDPVERDAFRAGLDRPEFSPDAYVG